MDTLRRYLRPEQIRELSLALIIFVAVAFFATQIENYLSGRFFVRVSTSVAITIVLATAQTLVIVTRNIDLSIGSIVGVAAYVTGQFLGANPDLSPAAAILFALAIGAGLGLINGLLVAYGRVPAIIVTLGTLAIYRTWLIDYAGAKTITADSLPQWLVDLPRLNLFSAGELDIRGLFVLAVVIAVVIQLALTYLPWGRRLYAIGSNPEAARMAGLPAPRLVVSAYAICGALAGLAGFMFLARFGTITVTAGQGLELQAVAAAVVGGVSTAGGSGTLLGALLGAILIDTLNQSLTRMPGVSEFWRDALLGLLILVSVATDYVLMQRLRRLWIVDPLKAKAAPAPAPEDRHAP